MDWCNNRINNTSSRGCLSISTCLIKDKIEAKVQNVNNPLNINTILLSSKFQLETKKIGIGLQITCGIVCSVNDDYYLEISKDTLWLTPDMLSEQFDIYSNVVWKID